MTINFSSLYTRLGKIFGTYDDNVAAMAAFRANIDDIATQYGSNRDLIANLIATQEPLIQTMSESQFDELQEAAMATLFRMVNDDVTVSPPTNEAALRELFRQMVDESESVDASDVEVTITAGGSNVGDGGGLATVSYDGTQEYENAYAETIEAKCVRDGYSRATAALAGLEEWEVRGSKQVPEWSPDWPAGSNASLNIRTGSSEIDAGANVHENLLTNSGFETFTVANTPDNWTIEVGTAGVDLFSNSTSYRGSLALRLLGDGSTLVKWSQTFGSASGTLGRLKPLTWYAARIALRKDATVSAGVLRVSVQDSANNVLWSSNVSVTLSGLTTSYAATTVMFRSGTSVPDGCKMVVELTTAMTSTQAIFIDELVLLPMAQVYTGGPHVALFAGAANYAVNDRFAIAVTNDGAGEIQRWFQRFFGINQYDLVVPSDTSDNETIADSLVS